MTNRAVIPSATTAATVVPTSSLRRQRQASAACRTSPEPALKEDGSLSAKSKVLDMRFTFRLRPLTVRCVCVAVALSMSGEFSGLGGRTEAKEGDLRAPKG